jgi:hypothetical protein
MKISKFLVPTIGFSCLFGSSVQGASTMNFVGAGGNGAHFGGAVNNSNGPNIGEVSGVTGWSQDNPNPEANFDKIDPLAYIDTWDFGSGDTDAGHLGTTYGNDPFGLSTTVSTDTGVLNFLGLEPVLLTPKVSLNLAIGVIDLNSYPNRDAFSVELMSSTDLTLAEIKFVPTVGEPSKWDVSVGTNGNLIQTSASIVAGASYKFDISLGAATTFSYGSPSQDADWAIETPGISFLPFGGLSYEDMDSIAMTHIPLADGQTTANYLVFDDIVLSVPEPSGAALLLLGSAFLMGRRRA